MITVILFLCGCSSRESIEVTATAYTSTKGQTDTTPFITAWGDRLEPGMKSIAISRDLMQMGLTHGSKVRIEGFEGEYTVLDKMHKRWKNKIDIYMGLDRKAALQWGKRRVRISWYVND